MEQSIDWLRPTATKHSESIGLWRHVGDTDGLLTTACKGVVDLRAVFSKLMAGRTEARNASARDRLTQPQR